MGLYEKAMIKQKNYSEEEYKAKKIKSFGVARRILIMSQLMYIATVNTFLSLGLFVILVIGTSAIPYFFDIHIDFGPETFVLRGGFFATICVVFLIALAISAFWYAIGYKKLEIMCIHLDGKLHGAFEVNKVARKDNLANNIERAVGLIPSNFSSISGSAWISSNYLNKNGIKTINTNVFRGINAILIFGQISFALLCVVILIK